MMIARRTIATVGAAALAASLLVVVHGSARAQDGVVPTVGDCLVIEKGTLWDFYGGTSIVSCDEAHQSEVYGVTAYPESEGAPSTIGDRAWELFGEDCSYRSQEDYLGTGAWVLPVRVSGSFRLPTDEQWEKGARWVLCITYRPDAKYQPISYQGALPTILAGTPGLEVLSCMNGVPKTGLWNPTVPCTKKAKWLVIGGIGFKGKPSQAYPKDVQKKADSLCAKNAKGLLVKGAKTPARAGLGPKNDMSGGDIFADCFVALPDWNGKTK